jgi:hypothetical protein
LGGVVLLGTEADRGPTSLCRLTSCAMPGMRRKIIFQCSGILRIKLRNSVPEKNSALVPSLSAILFRSIDSKISAAYARFCASMPSTPGVMVLSMPATSRSASTAS